MLALLGISMLLVERLFDILQLYEQFPIYLDVIDFRCFLYLLFFLCEVVAV